MLENKKKLLELCLSPDLGGLELYMVRSAKALNDDFNVISLINENGKLEQYYDDTEYKYIKIVKKSNLLVFSLAKKIAKIIDDNKIDVVHMHWTKDIPVTVLAKIFSKRKPKLVQTRNMTMTRFKNDFYHRFLYKHMDMILAVTYQVAEQVKKFVPKEIRPRVEVLYMSSDKVEMLSIKEIESYKEEIDVKSDDFVVGMVGRIEESKGQYLLIEAVEKLKSEGSSIKVCFVGHAMEESYQRKLEDIVLAKGLSAEVVFLGFTKNPHRFMQMCDCVVLATPCETFGLVVIEAMQVETVVLATNQCGPLEIIEDEKTGLLFEKNSSDDMASKIKVLYKDREKCFAIGKSGREKVEKDFSNDVQFKKLGLLLEKV